MILTAHSQMRQLQLRHHSQLQAIRRKPLRMEEPEEDDDDIDVYGERDEEEDDDDDFDDFLDE